MNSPSSHRVVIVDDNPEDIIRLIRALSELGIPSTWFKGDAPTNLPQNPLFGIRILFLDLHLHSGPFDPKTTAGVLPRLVPPTSINGPFLMVLWSSHTSETDSFKVALKNYNSDLNQEERIEPFDIISLPKNDFEDSDLCPLLEAIKSCIQKYHVFDLLLRWEALSTKAAANVAASISTLALSVCGGNVENHQGTLEMLFKKMVTAQGGQGAPQQIGDTGFEEHLREVLALIHSDAMRNLSATDSSRRLPSLVCGVPMSEDIVVAALNSMLLTAPTKNRNIPGAVFYFSSIGENITPFTCSVSDKIWRGVLYDVIQSKFAKDNLEIIESEVIPVVLEVSPACDVAQNNRKMRRYIPGILLPWSMSDKTGLGESLIQFGPLFFEGVRKLVLSPRYLFTTNVKPEPTADPLFRMLDHALTDIQARLGRQISRPGHLSIQM